MDFVSIGQATLYNADCRDVFPLIGSVDAVITDPPYSARCHAGHNASAIGKSAELTGKNRQTLPYDALSRADVATLAEQYVDICTGWIVWMSDSDLAMVIRYELEKNGRYAFAPLPFYQPGRSVRLSGDGPSSWTDWIVVARTKAQAKWGTLPGGYLAQSGWNDKEMMGGKPLFLMDALVRDYSHAGDLVLDSHMGKGTTAVACVRQGRRFIGCEINTERFDAACARIEQAYAQGSLLDVCEPPVQAAFEVWDIST